MARHHSGHVPHTVAKTETHHRTKHIAHSVHHAGHEGMYEGMEERRKQEREDASLFGESQHMYMANLPTEVILKTVARPYSGMPENLDDTMRGVDRQIGTDEAGMHKDFAPKKV